MPLKCRWRLGVLFSAVQSPLCAARIRDGHLYCHAVNTEGEQSRVKAQRSLILNTCDRHFRGSFKTSCMLITLITVDSCFKWLRQLACFSVSLQSVNQLAIWIKCYYEVTASYSVLRYYDDLDTLFCLRLYSFNTSVTTLSPLELQSLSPQK